MNGLVLACLMGMNTAAPPNIVLYVIDDLGFADLSLEGAAKRTGDGRAQDYKTPNIDKLAREGIMLDSYYVNRLCSPTRTSLLSSRYAYNLGLAGGVITNGFPVALRLNESTVADHMKALGYQTHAFGKWDIGYHTWKHTPTMRGFDSWVGYYNADEDYIDHSCGGGGCAKGVDMRNDTSPIPDDTTYSTILFTTESLRVLDHHDPAAGPFFLYAAYQALHGPLEAPQKYLNNCGNVIEHDRHIFCGMAGALDEGIGNFTAKLEALGLADNTIIALTTDNGGQNGVGGNNWPLRGNKATVFEGGVRGNGFIWGGSATALGSKGMTARLSTALMHNVDWGPTLISAAGGDASRVVSQFNLDGVDVFPALVNARNSGDPVDYGPRKDILLHLQGPNNGFVEEGWELTAALRSGDWKIVAHQVESPCPSDANISGNTCLKRATGWVQLHQDGEGRWATRSYIKPSATQICNGSTFCLFNVRDDPLEQHDVASENPDVLSKLIARIGEYNSTLIPNQVQPFDRKACPSNFPKRMWTPWLNSTPPLPKPKPHVPTFNSSVGPLHHDAGEILVSGWCCDPELIHPNMPNGFEPSMVRFSVARRGGQGANGPFNTVGTAVANVSRARLVQLGDCPNLNHGFNFKLPLKPYQPQQRYTLKIEALRPNNQSIAFRNGMICFTGSGLQC